MAIRTWIGLRRVRDLIAPQAELDPFCQLRPQPEVVVGSSFFAFRQGNSMFLAFQYGIMYVLSFATIITAFASALAVVLWLVMIVGRSVWRLFR